MATPDTDIAPPAGLCCFKMVHHCRIFPESKVFTLGAIRTLLAPREALCFCEEEEEKEVEEEEGASWPEGDGR